ncbi:Ig-like domain-containing protein [Carnobacterium divergens]|nr:Ig-like domain-containing protein [Carnobacterium divergens]MDO0875400.1 Ig-like domain-containing protein [Carnobacterium divergens]SUX16968.1 Uncharacterised protein [Carnobacterium divergens]
MKKEEMMKFSAKYLKRTVTFSAVVLTLGSAILPLAAQATESVDAVNNKVNGTTVEVSTAEELVAALKNVSVENIIFMRNIDLSKDVVDIPARNLKIDGRGNTLELNNHHIKGVNNTTPGVFSVTNLNVNAKEVDNAKLFLANGDNWQVNIDNSNFKGKRFIVAQNSTVIFSGKNNVSTKAENAWVRHVIFANDSEYNGTAATEGASFSAFYFSGTDVNGSVSINQNAKVNIDLSPDGNNSYPVFFDKISQINIKDGSKLSIKTPGKAFKVNGHNFNETPKINITNKAILEVNSLGLNNDAIIDINEKETVVNVIDSTIKLEGNTKNLIDMSKFSEFNLIESNYDLLNHKEKGNIFFGKSSLLSFNNVSLNAWNKTGGNYERSPELSYDSMVLNTEMDKYTSINTTSSNAELEKIFQMDDYGRISGQGKKEIIIDAPGMETITDKDTSLNGTGEPGNTVELTVNGEVIGEVTVNDNGTWSYPLEAPLNENDQVSAVQKNENGVSKATTETVIHEASKIPAPSIDKILDINKVINGLGEPGNTVIITIDGKVAGEVIVGTDGRWTFPLTEPLKAGTEVSAVQKNGEEISDTTTVIVTKLEEKTFNNFTKGYWQDYGLILEGLIDNGSWDLSNKDGIKKTISLVDSEEKEVASTNGANLDWDNGVGRYNGYQAIFTNEQLTALDKGMYKVKVKIESESIETTEQDLLESGHEAHLFEQTPVRDKFSKIDTRTISNVTFSTKVVDGKCYLVVDK